jgi:hypothetical protein
MSNPSEDHNGSRRQEADMRMLETLLRHALRPEAEAREARIQGVLQRLDESSVGRTENRRQAIVRISAKAKPARRWVSLAVALGLVVVIGLWWQMTNPTRRAYATVHETLRRASETGARHYRVAAVIRRPLVGEREISADLYVDGADRFLLRHPSMLMVGEVCIGGNEREYWIAPSHGPILIGGEKMLRQWMSDKSDFSTPYLHVTTILDRMSEHYDLQMLPDDGLTLPDHPDATVRCRRVRGVLRDSAGRLPRKIELWADCESGIARRLILDWELQPEQLGRSKVEFELVGCADLPRDWFEHASHHEEGRPIVRVGL